MPIRHFELGSMSVIACLQQLKLLVRRRTFNHVKSAIYGIFLAVTLSAQSAPKQRSVRVPDEATALKIAEPALISTYGKRQIDEERPLTATLHNGIWTVCGTLWCTDGNGNRTSDPRMCVGGSAVLKLRQRDAKILSIIHPK
jgi:hypothetical protein